MLGADSHSLPPCGGGVGGRICFTGSVRQLRPPTPDPSPPQGGGERRGIAPLTLQRPNDSQYRSSCSLPRRISRLPAWLAWPTTPSCSIRSMREAALL